MGVAMGNETTIAAKQNFSDLAKRLFVMPGTENEKLAEPQLSIGQKKSSEVVFAGHYVVYRIGLVSGVEEGEFHASVFVSTEFEELRVPFRFRVAKGSLSMQTQHLAFEPTFPVRIFKLYLTLLIWTGCLINHIFHALNTAPLRHHKILT